MHDIRLIRDDPVAFDDGLKRRGLAPLSAEALKRDADLRALLTRLQTAQARRNEASKLVGQAKAKKDAAQAPVGADETANVEIRRWGTMPNLSFRPKEHFDLGEGLAQMDFEAAARM